MYQPTNSRKPRRTTAKGPKKPVSLAPVQPFMVSVPIPANHLRANDKARIETLKVNATNGSTAIIWAKESLVKSHKILASLDIRATAKAVKVTAAVGDSFQDGDLRAAKLSRELVTA